MCRFYRVAGILTSMLDLIYLVVTAAFFALMFIYVRACERLGRDTTDHTETKR